MFNARPLRHAVACVAALAALALAPVRCAPTDLVPQGSVLLDAFADMADAGHLGPRYSARDFHTFVRYTRGGLAQILREEGINYSDPSSYTQGGIRQTPAFRAAVEELSPELNAAGVNTDTLVVEMDTRSTSVSGYVQPQFRVTDGNTVGSMPETVVLYRVTGLGDLSANSRYALSASNWPEDKRRAFYNQVGPNDFPAFNEGLVNWKGARGLTFEAGRRYEQWGGGYLGATMLSENSPAFNQLRIRFPFSLGAHLGRNYLFTQTASTFEEGGRRKYFMARRIEYRFSNRFSADFQEAIKSESSGTLWLIPLPFGFNSGNFEKALPGLNIQSADAVSNYVVNLGLAYAVPGAGRVYGQVLIDDLKSPLGNSNKSVPRKIGYLAGVALQPDRNTNVVMEYAHADPLLYTFRTDAARWQHEFYNEIGLPTGPNSENWYGRIDRKVSDRLTIMVSGRKRDRHDNSFPEPTDRHIEAGATYALNRTNWLGVTYHDYRQDPFPFTPGSPGYPAQTTSTPLSQGRQGNRIRLQVWDLSYGLSF